MTPQPSQRRIRPRGLPRRGPGTLVVWALPLVMALGGCANYTDYQAFIRHPRPLVTTAEYRIAPPDTIVIDSKRVREINMHQETIRPDGRITLPLLGSYFIAGKTCEEASADLQRMAHEFYDDADVSLRVAVFASKHVYIFGEVSTPGAYSYNGANTVLEMLARAQPTHLSDPWHVHILRPGKDGKLVKRMTIDLDKMAHKGDTHLDAVLDEGDIIYVPPNALAFIGEIFQELLLPIQPAVATVNGPANIESSGQSYGHGGIVASY